MTDQRDIVILKKMTEIADAIETGSTSLFHRESGTIKLMTVYSVYPDLSVKLACMRGMIAATKSKDQTVREKGMGCLSSILVSVDSNEPLYDYMIKQLGKAIKRNKYVNIEMLCDFATLLKENKLTSMTQRRMVFRTLLMNALHSEDHHLQLRAEFGLREVLDCVPSHWQARATDVIRAREIHSMVVLCEE